MPIYEFKCNKCGHVFEQLVIGSDKDQGYPCPACEDKDTCRQMSSFSCNTSESIGSASGLSSSCSSSGGFS